MKVLHKTTNTMKVLNFARSAKAPVIRAGVMMANIIWKTMKARWGTPATRSALGSAPTPFKANQSEVADDAADIRTESHGIAPGAPIRC